MAQYKFDNQDIVVKKELDALDSKQNINAMLSLQIKKEPLDESGEDKCNNEDSRNDENSLPSIKMELPEPGNRNDIRAGCSNDAFPDIHPSANLGIVKNEENFSGTEDKKPKTVKNDSKTKQKKPFSCSECRLAFKTMKRLNKHEKSHALLMCRKCQTEFPTDIQLKKHLGNKHGKKTFKCNKCNDVKFATNKRLQRHLNRIHVEKPFKCCECTKSFTSQKSLDDHLKFNAVKKIMCHECQMQFFSECLYKQHLNNHQVKCNECKTTFQNQKALIRHLEIQTVVDKALECNICQEKISYKCHFNRH